MEDIKILEELIEPFREQNRKGKKLILDITGIKYEHYEAIENLIARYKELEELLEEKTLRIGFENKDNYIPKSKVKELKKKAHNELDKNGITRAYQLIIDQYFDELLEES